MGSSLVLGLGLEWGIWGKGKGRGWGYSAWFTVGSESVILTLKPMHTETYGTPHSPGARPRLRHHQCGPVFSVRGEGERDTIGNVCVFALARVFVCGVIDVGPKPHLSDQIPLPRNLRGKGR